MAKGHSERAQPDIAFTHIVASAVRKSGYEIVGKVISPAFAVEIADDYSRVALVCTRATGTISRELVNAVHKYRSAEPSVLKVALVWPVAGTDRERERIEKSFGVDVVPITDVKRYLDEWKEIVEDTSDFQRTPQTPSSRPSRGRATTAVRIKENADTIIVLVRSLALQIDTKIEALKTSRPNSDEGMAARDAAISEYQELRKRVAELEKAVVRLKQPRPKTAEVVKAGSKFSDSVEKWWSKSSGKVLDKSADVGIVLASTGILALMGINPAIAAGVAAAVVTGKSMAGVFKSAINP